MNILETLIKLRDDLKTWVTNNLVALDAKIESKTIPIDGELNSESTNPVQNQAIAKEINSINERVGDTPVATQISRAINAQEHFSGDYNDLTNAPDISEDESGNMVIADESGNIIFKADADGIHTTVVSLNGETAASEKYVDEAVANINIPEVDFAGYATETYVDNKVADLVNSAPEALNTLGELAAALENHEDAYDALLETVGSKATHTDLENLKEELSESITAEADEWKVVDNNGNIIFSVDADGAHTTSMSLNGEAVATEEWVENKNYLTEHQDISGKSDVGHKHVLEDITDLPNYATEAYVDNSLNEKINDVVYSDEESVDTSVDTINADTLGGHPASDFAMAHDVENMTADDVGARPNTWLPTIAEIGAAPDGFGLGYDCQPINSWDDAITTGFYKSNGNTPEGFWWWGYAISHDKNNVVQTIYREDNYGNLVGCQRKSSDGEWLEWEFVNPPMNTGVEYRTTERYHGLPVYVKTITGMALPGNGTTSIEHGIEGWYRTLRYAINTENTFRIFAAYSGITDMQVSDKTISITTVNNASTDANVEITLWYLKL